MKNKKERKIKCSSPSSPENRLWERMFILQKKLQAQEVRTLDGYKPVFEIDGSNNFPVGSSNYKLRKQFLDYSVLIYKQLENEIVMVAEKLQPFIKKSLTRIGK